MRFGKALDQVDEYLTPDWGAFTMYTEIDDDHFAVRQVQIYADGRGLAYDRERWQDLHGSLGEARFTEAYEANCREQWMIKEIGRDEFEAAWTIALEAPNQPQRYEMDGTEWPAMIRLRTAKQKRGSGSQSSANRDTL